MPDALMLEARAISAVLAERAIASIEILTAGTVRTMNARETDLPTELVRLAYAGGEVRARNIHIGARQGVLEVLNPDAEVSNALDRARTFLAGLADPPA